jgi:hypothetical protein
MLQLTMRVLDRSIASPRDATSVKFVRAFLGSVRAFLSAFRQTSWLLAHPLAPTMSVKAIHRCTLIATPGMAACKAGAARLTSGHTLLEAGRILRINRKVEWSWGMNSSRQG